MEMELTNENGIVPQKKAIVLPILGKKKQQLLKQDLTESTKKTTPTSKSKPKGKKSEEPVDLPPELEPQVTIPPIKKRLKQAEQVEPVSKPKTSTAKKNDVKKPQQMSIMAFVQKKKEEAL